MHIFLKPNAIEMFVIKSEMATHFLKCDGHLSLKCQLIKLKQKSIISKTLTCHLTISFPKNIKTLQVKIHDCKRECNKISCHVEQN